MRDSINLIIEAFEKATLIVTCDTPSIESKWCVKYSTGVISDWKNSGVSVLLNSGSYEIEFSEVIGYNKPDNYTCFLKSGQTKKINISYTKRLTSDLQISFTIPILYQKYLSWKLTQLLGDTIVDWSHDISYKENLPNGKYQLQITDYVSTPILLDEKDKLYDGLTGLEVSDYRFYIHGETYNFDLLTSTNISRDYKDPPIITKYGIICCTINPEKAKPFIKWKLSISNIWFDSGKNVIVPYGTYYLQTTSIHGWTVSRKDEAIIVDSNKDIILIGIKAEQNGNLRVKLNIKDVSRWRPVNTLVWYMDNEEISLYPNTYEIEFKPVENYATPINQFYKIYEDEVYIFSNTYYHLGSLQINIESDLLLETFGDPLWRVKNTNIWRRSGEIIFLDANTYTIEFNTVGNIFTHENITVLVSNETTNIEEISFIGVNLFVVPTKSSINFYNFNNLQKLNLLPNLLSFIDTNQVTTNYNDTLLAIAHNNSPYLTIYDMINYDLYLDKQLVKPLGGCRSLDFSNDGKYLAVSHNNFPYLTVYNTGDWTQVTIDVPPTNYCNTVKFSPNSLYLAVGFDTAPFIRLYNTQTFHEISIIAPTKEVFSCQFDSNNRYLGVGCYHTAYVYDINVSSVMLDVHGTIYGVEFFNDYLIIISSLYLYVYHYKKETLTYIEDNKILIPIPNINNYITLSPDLKHLVIGCVDYPYVIIYETTNWTQVAFDGSFLNYCKKMVISGDLSLREYVNTPTNKYPINKYKGLREFEPLLSSDFSCFSLTYTVLGDDLLSDVHIKSQWRLLDENEEIVYDSDVCDDLISHLIPESYFDVPKDYFWQVRHKGDQFGWSYWSKITSFSVVYSYIKKPVNTSPVNASTDVIEHPILTSSNFESINVSDIHVFSEWRIYQRIRTLDVLKFTSNAKPLDLITFTVPEGDVSNNIFGLEGSDTRLEPIEYVWQVRHKGQILGWSDWSDKTSFTTGDWRIEKPVNISPYNNESDINEENLILSASEFTVLNADDTHKQTKVEIYATAHTINRDGSTTDTEYLFHSYLFDDTNENVDIVYPVPVGLLTNGEVIYKWRIAYKGVQLNWSEWSDKTSFTTRISQTSNVFVNIYPSEILPGMSTPLRWKWKQKDSLDSTYSSYIIPTYTVTQTINGFDINTPNYIQIPSEQSIKISFEDYLGYGNPAEIISDVFSPGETYLYNANYVLSSTGGQIQCNITDSLLGNAKWRIKDTISWRNSGYVETNLLYGVYNIEFKDVTGYIRPDAPIVNGNSMELNINFHNIVVRNIDLIVKSATYTVDDSLIYYVIVNIERGQWRLNSEDTWYNGGDRVSLLGKSVESIVFSDVVGYVTPNDITFQVPNSYDNNPDLQYNPEIWPKTLSYLRSYSSDNIGQLKCYLSPGYAKWKLSTATTLNNTVTTLDVVAGTYTINFEKINGYKEIPNTTAIVTSNNLTTISKVYELEPDVGSFRLFMWPPWGGFRIKSTEADWHQSDAIIPSVPSGEYILEFKPIDNYITPKDLTVEVEKDKLTEVSILYELKTDGTKITIDITGIDFKTIPVYWKVTSSLNNVIWSDFTDWVQYYKSDILNSVIRGPGLYYYKIEIKPVTGYTLNKASEVVLFKGDDITVQFNFIGATSVGYGKVNLLVDLLESNQNKTTIDDSVYGPYLEFQHVEISNTVYINRRRDGKNIKWDGKWIKYADSFSIFNKLSTSKKHAFKIKPINNYFNLGEFGNISYVDFNDKIEATMSLSFINYNFTSVNFCLPFFKDNKGFTSPPVPDLSANFNINVRTKNEYEEDFGEIKSIQIYNNVVTHTVNGVTYQLIASDPYTLIDLFGVNKLGYISFIGFNILQTGTTTTMINYDPKTLITLNGLVIPATLSPTINTNTTNPTQYISMDHTITPDITGSIIYTRAIVNSDNYYQFPEINVHGKVDKFRVFIPPGTCYIFIAIYEYGRQSSITRYKTIPTTTTIPTGYFVPQPPTLLECLTSDRITSENNEGKLTIMNLILSGDTYITTTTSGWLYMNITGGTQSSVYYNKIQLGVKPSIYNDWYDNTNWATDVEGII
jgi:hypothetical protein